MMGYFQRFFLQVKRQGIKRWIAIAVIGTGFIYMLLFIMKCSRNGNAELSGNLLKRLASHHHILEDRLKVLSKTVKKSKDVIGLPIIYAITPTYKRYTQKADLTRLSQTFMHIQNFRWIVVEDSEHRTDLVTTLLKSKGIKYIHLNMKTQAKLKKKEDDPHWKKHRGLDQRNLALEWIRGHVTDRNGIVYFADDDNTYDLELFQEMRSTKKVSVWPVALVGGLRWEGPICVYGKVISFFTAWQPNREFPIDMASFAININLIMDNPNAFINPESKRGYLESDFLHSLGIRQDDLEAKANNCRKILVWHTRTQEPKMKQERRLIALGMGSDLNMEI